MQFKETIIEGAWLVLPERLEDDRGFFARTWCEDEFAQKGPRCALHMVQSSVSFNRLAGTLRGMHYAAAPSEETKLVRCTQGAVHDVLLDLRQDSPSFLKHCSFELSAGNRHALFIPAGIAHGFQTLVDETEVLYQMSQRFNPEHSRGVRWNDPVFGIQWPDADRIIHERDSSYPDYARAAESRL